MAMSSRNRLSLRRDNMSYTTPYNSPNVAGSSPESSGIEIDVMDPVDTEEYLTRPCRLPRISPRQQRKLKCQNSIFENSHTITYIDGTFHAFRRLFGGGGENKNPQPNSEHTPKRTSQYISSSQIRFKFYKSFWGTHTQKQ